MDGTKSLLQSTTFWGVAVSVLGKLISIWGYELTPEDSQLITQNFSLLASFVGDAVAIYGRVKASKKIG